MKVILLQDVPKVGKKYEEKNIADGHARNALIPQGKAMVATSDNKKRIAKERERYLKKQEEKEERFKEALSKLGEEEILVHAKANEKGHLFAGISREDISTLLKEKGILDVEPNFIYIQNPIKEVGSHTVTLELGGNKADITLNVQPEKER